MRFFETSGMVVGHYVGIAVLILIVVFPIFAGVAFLVWFKDQILSCVSRDSPPPSDDNDDQMK